MTLTELVRLALEEDVGPGDVTTLACVGVGEGRASIYAKEPIVVSGQAAAGEVFRQLGAAYTPVVGDGEETSGEVGTVSGPLAALLTGERTALNFLMRLSGVATHTRKIVSASGGMKVLDTRKTTPLLRALEKAAVRHGGGHNHRLALYDGVLIKDNHVVAAGGVAEAIRRARAVAHPLLKLEVEIEQLSQLPDALAADVVMLDNMDDATIADAVRIAAGRVTLEASGNMTAERAARLCKAGVDCVSMGGLIHAARWVDLSMRVVGAG